MSVEVVIKNSIGENENYTATKGVKLNKADGSGLQNFYLVTDATATADAILYDKTAYVNTPDGQGGRVEGTIYTKTASDLTAEDNTVTVPKGYYDSTYTKAIANGSATTPDTTITKNPTVTVDSITGSVTASYSESQPVTPTVVAGYVSLGSAGTVTTQGETVISDANVLSENIRSGESVLGQTGTYSQTSNPITPDTVVSGYEGFANGSAVIQGTIPRKSSANMTAIGDTVTAPAGYYASDSSKSVASGSVTIPDTSITANPSISVDSSGLITASVSESESITPTVTAGYISSVSGATASVSGSNESQLTTLSATSYDPTSSDQTILSGQYLTGNQTIRGVKYTKTDSGTTTTLDGSVIKKDVVVNIGTSNDADSVVSITGQYEGVEPAGTYEILDLSSHDVSTYKYAQVAATEASKITANNGGNIVSGVTILGQPGSATVLDAQTKTNLTLTALPYQITPDSPHNGISSATITSISGLSSGAIATGYTVAGIDGSYDTVSNASQVCTRDDIFYGKKVYTNGEYIIGTYTNSTTIREGYLAPQIYFNRNAVIPQNTLDANIVILGSKFLSGCAGYELYIPPSSSDVRVSGEVYTSISTPSGDPSALGYYEVEKEVSRYVLTSDTTALSGKTYYSATYAPTHSVYSNYYQIIGNYLYQAQTGGLIDPYFEVAEVSVSVGDLVEGLYEATTAVPVYQLSTDSEVLAGKTYYQQSTADILVYSSAIKASFLDFESLGLASTDCVVHKVLYSFIDGFISPIAVSYGALAPVSTYLIDNGNVISHIYFNTSLSVSDVDTMLGTLLYTEQVTYEQTTYNACILGFADNTRRLVAVQDFLVQDNYAVGWIDGNDYTLVYISNAVPGITTAGWQVDHVDPSSPITINMLSFYPTIWENRCLVFTRAPVVIPAAAGQEAVYGQILAQSWTGGN